MRQGQHNNNNKRSRNRGRRQPNPASRVFESNGPDVRVRGTASHIAEKYTSLGRDALASGDIVQAENYFQHAEHYQRIVAAAQAYLQQQNPDMASRTYGDEDEDGYGDELPDRGEAGFGQRPVEQRMDDRPREHQRGEWRDHRNDHRGDGMREGAREARGDQRGQRGEWRDNRGEREQRGEWRDNRENRDHRDDRQEGQRHDGRQREWRRDRDRPRRDYRDTPQPVVVSSDQPMNGQVREFRQPAESAGAHQPEPVEQISLLPEAPGRETQAVAQQGNSPVPADASSPEATSETSLPSKPRRQPRSRKAAAAINGVEATAPVEQPAVASDAPTASEPKPTRRRRTSTRSRAGAEASAESDERSDTTELEANAG
ncbi:DUF4167 domain-containing protein [Rhodoligotrophos defluvii]|uniref:DUF4167 domain-containing protein n=1 Tax=Rhodoligotrophos defluvii TaxID=2561934 RepID=UPI0010C9D1A4